MRKTYIVLSLIGLIWTSQAHAIKEDKEQLHALLKEASHLLDTLPVLGKAASVDDALKLDIQESVSSIRIMHAKLRSNPMAYDQGYDISVLTRAIYTLHNLRMRVRRFQSIQAEPFLNSLETEIVSLSAIPEAEVIPDYIPAETGWITIFDGGYEGGTDEEKAALAKQRADLKKQIEDNRKNSILNTRQRILGEFHRFFIKIRLPLVPE